MIKLVLVRHGQSVWNLENKFTGWTDVNLSEKGINEAIDAGKKLKKLGYSFDIAYTSLLKRANNTLFYILKELNEKITINKTYMLNERHYGALQGLNKDIVRKVYGSDQVFKWRRSTNEYPPLLDEFDKRNPNKDPLYKNVDAKDLPLGENLSDTIKRVLSYYLANIEPEIRNNKKVIIVAHGNTLRALVKYLDNLNENEVENLNIPTGVPLCYELDDKLKPIRHYYID